jgi:hypothetical protein
MDIYMQNIYLWGVMGGDFRILVYKKYFIKNIFSGGGAEVVPIPHFYLIG